MEKGKKGHMETLRKPFQGVRNIVLFNWHFYALSIALVVALFAIPHFTNVIHQNFTRIPAMAILLVTGVSLLVSAYVYDISKLYTLPWLENTIVKKHDVIVNVNAGFDETSALLHHRYPEAKLIVLDFYDPEKHTEVSIKRARKAYPPYPNTISTQTNTIEINNASVDIICAVLSAHEIRDQNERQQFFTELKRILKPAGQILVTEHLRDFPNFLAYTIGFFHFHSKSIWQKTFQSSGFKISQEIKTTPFISTFILEHAATT